MEPIVVVQLNSLNLISADQVRLIKKRLGEQLAKETILEEAVAELLKNEDHLVNELLSVIRTRAEAIGDLLVRKVPKSIDTTYFVVPEQTNEWWPGFVRVLPPIRAVTGDYVYFFRVRQTKHHDMADDEVEREYRKRELIPIDPRTLAAINQNGPAFRKRFVNGTHWKDAHGEWCYVNFWGDLQGAGHSIHSLDWKGTDNNPRAWMPDTWFAGVVD